MRWFIQNWGTVVTGLVVLGIVITVTVFKIRASMKGKSSCGCGCVNCAMKGCCHGNNKTKTKTD